MLERVANPAAGKHYVVRLTCPEFTSLCPLTGQPDFAHIMIDYIPKDWIVESKSFKLLMGSYRNHGAFHEACTMEIAGRLVRLLDPVWLRIGAYWYPQRRHSHRCLLAIGCSARWGVGAGTRRALTIVGAARELIALREGSQRRIMRSNRSVAGTKEFDERWRPALPLSGRADKIGWPIHEAKSGTMRCVSVSMQLASVRRASRRKFGSD